MANVPSTIFRQLFNQGMKDPLIQTIAGLVVIAAVVTIIVHQLGDGRNTVIAISLCLAYGIVAAVLKVILFNADNPLLKWIGIVSAALLTGVFLIFVVLALPAVTFCWPPAYADFLGRTSCAATRQAVKETNRSPDTDLLDHLGNFVSRYPARYFQHTERIGDTILFSWTKTDKRTFMTISSKPTVATQNDLKLQFDIARKVSAKHMAYCFLREKMFVVSYIDFHNRIFYITGRNRNERITTIQIEYDQSMKEELDSVVTLMAQYFWGDARRSAVIEEVCSN